MLRALLLALLCLVSVLLGVKEGSAQPPDVARPDARKAKAELAAAAVALRLDALEIGRYPTALEDLPDAVVAALSEARIAEGGLEYDPPVPRGSASGAGPGGPRLRLTSDDLLSSWSESRRAELEPLLVWELPALR